MTNKLINKPCHVCKTCGHDAGSKFALKRHRQLAHDYAAFKHTPLAYDRFNRS